MSRVYEALTRAHNQQAGPDEPSTRKHQIVDKSGERADGPIPILRPRVAECFPGEEDPALPILESATPSLAAQVRGPALVVGRCQPEYRKVVEQFHLFAVGLQNWAADNSKRVFMLTSALSGEGKSFMAINLAASLARIGNRVLLIDADLRSPTLHRAFNLAPLRGLFSYLTEEADFRSCLHSTQIPGLLLVAADGTSYTPTEALAGSRMREFVREARSLVPPHFIIIDAPAAAAVPESQILNGLIDALVVVVAANRTPRAQVKQTIEKAAGTQIYGIALNRFELPHSAVRSYYPEKYANR